MAELRTTEGMTMRDVFHVSRELSRIQRSTGFLIPPSRLSDIESKGVVPTIHRLYALSVAYDCPVQKLMKFYGMDLSSSPVPRERLQAMIEKRHRMHRRIYSRVSSEARARIERLLFETEFTQSEIALKCGVSQSKVCTIARRIGFSPRMRKSKRPRLPLSSRDRGIIRLARKGRTYREIGQLYGVTRQRAQQIVKMYGGNLSATG